MTVALNTRNIEWPKLVVTCGSVLIVGWLILYPLYIIFEMGLKDETGRLTIANYVRVFSEPGLVSALVNSLIVSAAVTVITLLLGVPVAWGVARTSMPLKTFVRAMIVVAFVIPNFIGAVAWILMLGPNAGWLNVLLKDILGEGFGINIYSLQGLVIILSVSFYPIVFFAVSAALENMDRSYEEATRMSGASNFRGSIQITLPLVAPAILSSAILVFLDSMGAFGAAAAIANGAGFHVMTTKIYELFSYPPQFELAAAAATPIIFLTLLGLMIQRYALGRRRYAVISGKAARDADRSSPATQAIFLIYSFAVIAITVLIPFGVLIRTSFLRRWSEGFGGSNLTLANYDILFDFSTYIPTALANSVIIGLVVASISVMLGIVIVWLVERSAVKGRSVLVFISTVTFAFPGLALAVGFVIGYSTAAVSLYGTLWLFFIAFTAQRFPFAFVFLRNAVKQMAPELEEAGRMSGAGWLRTIKDISIPILKTGIIAAWIMVFAVSLRELSMAILLYVPGLETLPTAIFNYVDDGRFPVAASLSVLLITVSILSVAVVHLITHKPRRSEL